MFFTYSQNYGIFPDEAKSKKENNSYRYENGLIQRSGLVQIGFDNFFKQLGFQVSYGIDHGKLLEPCKALLFSINPNPNGSVMMTRITRAKSPIIRSTNTPCVVSTSEKPFL